MALRVQAANRPEFDNDGFFHAAIVAIKPIPSTDKYKAPRYRWTIEGKGTVRTFGVHFTTPAELGNVYEEEELAVYEEMEGAETVGDEPESPAHNALARVCLALELITEVDLDPHLIGKTIATLDLEKAIGLAVMCRLAKRTMVTNERGIERRTPYITPILETLALDK